MPYFVYKIFEKPIRRLEKLEEHAAYRDASGRAKQLRSEQPKENGVTIKMIFADSELHAEDLLNQIREPAPELGDD